jgi:hypothetical protein
VSKAESDTQPKDTSIPSTKETEGTDITSLQKVAMVELSKKTFCSCGGQNTTFSMRYSETAPSKRRHSSSCECIEQSPVKEKPR